MSGASFRKSPSCGNQYQSDHTHKYTFKMLAARPVARLDNKRRAVLDPRKRQFAKSQWQEQSYEHAMNFYNIPPTGDIALEEFEEWGIARLKGMNITHSHTSMS